MPPELPHNPEETALNSRSKQRFFELDALRGLAAFCVIGHHLRLALPGDPLHHRYWFPLSAGSQAVILFFILSGYVLSIPYWKGSQLPYPRYLVRRICRIYLPYLAALALAWACAAYFLPHQLPLTPWFQSTWKTPLTLSLLGSEMLMSTRPDLNTAFWSLHYEMEMSILFPLLCFGLRRISLAIALTLILLFAACGTVNLKDIMYMAFFLIGALLSWHRTQLAAWFSKLPNLARATLAILSFALYYLPLQDQTPLTQAIADSVYALASTGIILLALNLPSFQKLLRHPIPEYLGRISYSLYLVHGSVIFALLYLLYGKIPLPLIALLIATLSIVLAHLFCLLIEEPTMRLGKKLTS